MKLLSGRAPSTPEGTQTSHRPGMRPAGATVLYRRFEIKLEINLGVWASGEGLQHRFSLDYGGEQELTFGPQRLACASSPVDSGELLHIPQLGDKRVYQK